MRSPAARVFAAPRSWGMVFALAGIAALAGARPGRCSGAVAPTVAADPAQAKAVDADPEVIAARASCDKVQRQLDALAADDVQAGTLSLQLEEADKHVAQVEAASAKRYQEQLLAEKYRLPEADEADPLMRVPAVRMYVVCEALRRTGPRRADLAAADYTKARTAFLSAHYDPVVLHAADAQAATAAAALAQARADPDAHADGFITAIDVYHAAALRLASATPPPTPVDAGGTAAVPVATSQTIPVRFDVAKPYRIQLSAAGQTVQQDVAAGQSEAQLGGVAADCIRRGRPVVVQVYAKRRYGAGYMPQPAYTTVFTGPYVAGLALSIRQSNVAFVQQLPDGTQLTDNGTWSVSAAR
jgi:hypothetical protein